jgi:hypothetical protein
MNDLLTRSPFDPASQHRLVIVADWLPPDFGAVGQYMQMRARAFAERGHDVTLVGLGSGPHPSAGAIGRKPHGIRLRAPPVPVAPGERLFWTLWTDWRLLAIVPPFATAEGILFTGSPPFMIHLLAPLKFAWRSRLVYRITDFHPECLVAARQRPSLLLGVVLAMTNFWRRRIDCFEVLGEDQRRRLNDTGIPNDRIRLVRDGSPVAFSEGTPVEPLPPNLAGSCVLLYSGNYGVAHEVETVVEGYRRHHREGSGRVRLWLSATGEGAEEVTNRLTQQQLPFYRSMPVPLARLAGLLRAPHAHLITLRDRFVGFVMPSKIYACLESSRPILFVGSADSDVDLLARAVLASYWRVSCGDSQGFASALEELADLAEEGRGGPAV